MKLSHSILQNITHRTISTIKTECLPTTKLPSFDGLIKLFMTGVSAKHYNLNATNILGFLADWLDHFYVLPY
jgi:hypothetical protein